MISATAFQIDGTTVPIPTSYDFDIEDLSSEATGRTLDGVMHKDVVAIKDYYTCKWSKVSWSDAALILNLVDGKRQVTVSYVDPRVPDTVLSNTFYVGKRSGKVNNLNNPGNTWSEITLQFIRI